MWRPRVTPIQLSKRYTWSNADTDFHSALANRHDPAAHVRTAAVVIEDNVWLAAQTGVLPGTSIGRNSVVSFGAVCSGRFPADVVVVGNPGRVAGRLSQPDTAASG